MDGDSLILLDLVVTSFFGGIEGISMDRTNGTDPL